MRSKLHTDRIVSEMGLVLGLIFHMDFQRCRKKEALLRKGQMVGSKSGNYSETAEKLVKNYQREEIFTILLEFEKKIELQMFRSN